MITPSQASAISELLRDCERALDPDRPHGADVLRMLRDDLRDWARDLDGLVRDADWQPVPGGLRMLRIEESERPIRLLSLCPHCNDPLCDDRCKEIR